MNLRHLADRVPEPDETELHIGSPRNIGVGIPHVIEIDRWGRDVIYWDIGPKTCELCSGYGTYDEWKNHLREVTVQGVEYRTARTGIRRYCPVLSEKYTTLKMSRSHWGLMTCHEK